MADDRKLYDEKEETKQIPLTCPHCRQENTYPVRWKVRTKKNELPRGSNEEDRAADHQGAGQILRRRREQDGGAARGRTDSCADG